MLCSALSFGTSNLSTLVDYQYLRHALSLIPMGGSETTDGDGDVPHLPRPRTHSDADADSCSREQHQLSHGSLLRIRYDSSQTSLLPHGSCDAFSVVKARTTPLTPTLRTSDTVFADAMNVPRIATTTIAFSAMTLPTVMKTSLLHSPRLKPGTTAFDVPAPSTPPQFFQRPHTSLHSHAFPSRPPASGSPPAVAIAWPTRSPKLSISVYESNAGSSSRSRTSSADGDDPGDRATKRARTTTPGTDDELLIPALPRKTISATSPFDLRSEGRAVQPHAENTNLNGQSALEKAFGMVAAPVGSMRGSPRTGLDGVRLFLERMQGAARSDGPKDGGLWQPYVRAPRAPANEYLARLEDAFGPGDAMRGEEFIPTEESSDEQVLNEEVEEAGMEEWISDVGRTAETAQEWISQIQVAVKGKRQLTPEDLKSLSDTLHSIALMDKGMAEAMADELPRLRQSLEQLANVEIPFGDEHKVRTWARNLVKHWPV
ncbi:hypothetical protein C8F01DRAFT_1116204 [Mycena amicta]|nr:hypothetical protein C8F01DRAFT_1116204 [Mycena amicta]